MEIKTKFLLTHIAIGAVAVLALGGAYETYDLKQKVDAAPKAQTVEQQVARDTADGANAYFQQNQSDAKAVSVTCVKAAAPTKYTCDMTLQQPSTGQSAHVKYTVTWTKSAGLTNIVEAK